MSEKGIGATENKLKQSVERLEALMDEIPTGVINVDIKGKITYVNKTILQGTGYLREELVGKNGFRLGLFPRETLKLLGRRMKEKLMGKPPSPLEIQFKRKDGKWMWVEISGKALWEHGVPVGIQIVGQDITERKRAEEELRSLSERESKSAREWQELFDASIDIITLISPDYEILRINRVGYESIGRKREELIGKKCYEVVHGLCSPIDGCPCKDVIRTKKAGVGEVTQGGRHYLVTASPVLDKNNELIAFAHIIKDITERKRAEEALRATNKELREMQEQLVRSERLAAIGQLAGGVGHELRNPLGAIKNAAYYVKGKVAESELSQKEPRVMEFLDIMDDEVNASNKIISDLLGFSRVGKPSVSPARIEKVIEDALSRTAIPENIEVTKKLDTELPEIDIDPDQIQQVLVNMITNAVEAMPEGGKLTIAARGKGKFLEVEIADTGCGIPQEAVDKIFDPLFTTRAKGIGLGLAVCKAIIDRHKGNIQVESQVRKGTTFTIKLPLKVE